MNRFPAIQLCGIIPEARTSTDKTHSENKDNYSFNDAWML
jgi:hypothetical protein